MFQDTSDGQTHHNEDGCVPCHECECQIGHSTVCSQFKKQTPGTEWQNDLHHLAYSAEFSTKNRSQRIRLGEQLRKKIIQEIQRVEYAAYEQGLESMKKKLCERMPEEKDMINQECFCDGNKKVGEGYCNCGFSEADGYNLALSDIKKLIQEV